MKNELFTILLDHYITGSISEEERLQLKELLDQPEYTELLHNHLRQNFEQDVYEGLETPGRREKIKRLLLKKIDNNDSGEPVSISHFRKIAWFRYPTWHTDSRTNAKTVMLRWASAAAVIIIIGTAAYLWNAQNVKPEIANVKSVPVINDVLPGSDKAILTLSNGEKIELKSATLQTITDGRLAINNKDGKLIYGKTDIVVYNTMTTPNGGQYQLTLPDGTHVWLNAASSITYPTAFTGNRREVSITGEAYFEVTKDPAKPFRVKTYKDSITVLGTNFNVHAYADESFVKTSLLEGSVKIGNSILKPGEAYLNGKVSTANVTQDVAWKNGLFNFNNADLPSVLRQLERWYDIRMRYEGKPSAVTVKGKMYRDVNLSDILEVLDKMGLYFKMEGRTIVVREDPVISTP